MQQVFTASQSFKLLFIDLKVNSPTALKRSPIAPLLVHIKIANMKVGFQMSFNYKISSQAHLSQIVSVLSGIPASNSKQQYIICMMF